MERLKDKTLSGRQRQRLSAVQLGLEGELSLPQIARAVGAGARSVSRWHGHYREEGLKRLVQERRGRGPKRLSHLAGPTCDSGDMISDGVLLPNLEPGDVVVAHVMGAYTSVTANDFNSVKRAKIISLDGLLACDESGTMRKASAD